VRRQWSALLRLSGLPLPRQGWWRAGRRHLARRQGRFATAGALALAGLVCLSAAPSAARDRFPGVEVEDRIDLVPVDNQILAIDSKRQRQRRINLEIGEQILSLNQRGLVAVVVTTARVLGITTELAEFQELRYEVLERSATPAEVFLGDRVALVPLRRRLIAMSTTTRSWQELALGPREVIEAVAVDNNIAAVLTQRRAIAFAPRTSQFIEILLTPQESIEDISAIDSSVTLTTSRRILIYRAGSNRWTELTRRNRPG
jgi:hypothetical protein